MSVDDFFYDFFLRLCSCGRFHGLVCYGVDFYFIFFFCIFRDLFQLIGHTLRFSAVE